MRSPEVWCWYWHATIASGAKAPTASDSTRWRSARRSRVSRSRSCACDCRTPGPASSRSARRSTPRVRRRVSGSSTSSCPPTHSTPRCCAGPPGWALSHATPTRTRRRGWSPTRWRASPQRPPLTKRTVPRCGRRRRAEPPARPSARSWQGAELGSELRGARRLLHGADTRRHPLCIPQHRGDARILECHAGRFEGRGGIRRHRAAQAIEVGVRLHVDLSVSHTNLDRLVDERPLGADRDHREDVLDVLGIEARAAVADQHADAPRNVRAVDAIGLERELEAILAERVVGCTARNAPSRVAELADVILANARRDVPGWIDGLADHREAAFGRPAIVATEPERIGADDGDAGLTRGTLEVEQAQLRDVHDDSLVAAARKDPGGGNDQLRADLRCPQVHARIRVRDLVHSEVVVARDVEKRLVRADDVAADLADHRLDRRLAGLGGGDAVGPHRLLREDFLGENGSRALRLRSRTEWRGERDSLRGTSRQQDAGERDGGHDDTGHGVINFDARRRVKPGLDSKKTHERAGRGAHALV